MGESLLSGLEAFGLSGLEGMNIFEEEKKPEEKKEAAKAPVAVLAEKDFLLDKSMTCPLCDAEFKAKLVKTGRAKLVKSELDLRPIYQELDAVKYDVIMCPECGYTALSRYFPGILQIQKQRIREKITPSFKPKRDTNETYTYDEAIDRYKMALVNAIVKGAKASEKAYICLKTSWMVRGKAEELGESHPDYAKTKAIELEYSKNAFEGFMSAISSESLPLCGMDETTINYLLAVLGLKAGRADVSQKMVSAILTSQTANNRMKDMARNLKEEIMKVKQ